MVENVKEPGVLSERSSYVDLSTGTTVIQWTEGPYKNQHLYFTSPSVTADNRWLVFISDREGGSPNLYAINRADTSIRRLSLNGNGVLRSYVYPRGGLRGLNKASPCLDARRNRLYYICDDNLITVDLDQDSVGEEKICRLPSGWFGAFSHVSPCGKFICIPYTDHRAFCDEADNQWEQMRKVPGRMEELGLVSRIYLVNVATGEMQIAAEVPFWVTHVQFDPAGTRRIIFNREGFAGKDGRPPHNRIWCLEPDGRTRPLSPEPHGEWRAHENWAIDGHSIIYHGGRDGHAFLAARTWEGELIREVHLEGVEFWHATSAVDGRRLYVDRPNGYISVVDPLNEETRMVDICRHDSIVEDQDAHPHPIVTPGGGGLVFTSVRTGNCNVYEAVLN